MSTQLQFFSKLSQNYIEILEDDEYYDVTIEVGKDPNVKIFRAHMIILCYRSSYFRRVFASNKKNNDGDLTHITLPNISPEIFQIILKYIYGGIISLNDTLNMLNMLRVLVDANQLHLQELVDYLQKYLIENKAELMEQKFGIIHRLSFQSNNLSELQQFCTNLMAKTPEKIFKSLDFTSIPEKSLILLIKRDDLQMKEIEVWEHILKWGLAQNPTLTPDPIAWSDNDFKMIENTLQQCLPLIRFYSLSSKEFLRKVGPYRKLLKYQLYEDLLNSYMDPDSEPNDDNISLPRNIKTDGIIDSKIINLNIVSIISRWIDKMDVNRKFSHLRELYLPYKFKLLLRGSRDEFTPGKFHELCDDIPYTVTFIKVKGTGEIIGGYNPSAWRNGFSTSEWNKAKDSFIFSFKNKDNLGISIFSHVKNMDQALFYNYSYGPAFGYDLVLRMNGWNSTGYNSNYCKQKSYEKKIRTEGQFLMEDYEVFQIITKPHVVR